MKVVGTIKEVRELVKEWNGKEIFFQQRVIPLS